MQPLHSLLRENARLLIRRLGLLEKDNACCCCITMPQCHVLVEIGRHKTLSVNDLAQLLNLDKSSVSKTVDKLVTSGLLQRDSSPDDRRYVVLTLSQEGQHAYEDIEARMETHFTKILQAIPPEKHAQVIESLDLFTNALKKVQAETPSEGRC
nr:MarR family transcriptional regulator [uncultured Anaeromusa sp.]